MMLLDTNVISELPRPRPSAAVLRWFARLDHVHLSVVTIEELEFGVARAPLAAQRRLRAWFDALLQARPTILEVNAAIARTSGELRALRQSRGRPAAQADMLIAATAHVHGLTLATRNGRDFDGCGVSIVNPFD